jgi:hypothetical protein
MQASIINLSRRHLWEIHSMATTDANARRAALARTQIFQALQPADIDLILARATTKRIPRGEVVLRRGDPSAYGARPRRGAWGNVVA